MYLGNPSTPTVRQAMMDGHIGCIDTLGRGSKRPPGVPWCADNGRFGTGWAGYDAWWEFLQRNAHHADTCIFAVAPDVVGDAEATIADSLPWLPRIRSLGYPAALVAQDGMERVEVPWDEFDALFIGGSTEWKLSRHARTLVGEAKARGKWVHMGRVNSRRRILYAAQIGCDSADGTFLAFGPDVNLPRVMDWLDHLQYMDARLF